MLGFFRSQNGQIAMFFFAGSLVLLLGAGGFWSNPLRWKEKAEFQTALKEIKASLFDMGVKKDPMAKQRLTTAFNSIEALPYWKQVEARAAELDPVPADTEVNSFEGKVRSTVEAYYLTKQKLEQESLPDEKALRDLVRDLSTYTGYYAPATWAVLVIAQLFLGLLLLWIGCFAVKEYLEEPAYAAG